MYKIVQTTDTFIHRRVEVVYPKFIQHYFHYFFQHLPFFSLEILSSDSGVENSDDILDMCCGVMAGGCRAAVGQLELLRQAVVELDQDWDMRQQPRC